MGVSMGFELDGKISPEMIKQAYALLQKEYPYLRCVLTQDNNLLSFVEKTPTPVRCSILHVFSNDAVCCASDCRYCTACVQDRCVSRRPLRKKSSVAMHMCCGLLGGMLQLKPRFLRCRRVSLRCTRTAYPTSARP